MKRLLLAGIALCLSAIVAPTATRAATPDVIHGGCAFDTDQQETLTGDQNVGVIYDVSVTTTGDLPPQPIDATVTCWIEVNGVEAPHTRYSYSGAGIQAGVDRISFASSEFDNVSECQAVAYADGSTESSCSVSIGDPIPPQEFFDAVNALLDAVGQTIHYVECGDDPSDICPMLCRVTTLLPGSYGPVTITPDGDVYVVDPLGLGLSPVYDCPPYVTS
jgi:hypothetical protein